MSYQPLIAMILIRCSDLYPRDTTKLEPLLSDRKAINITRRNHVIGKEEKEKGGHKVVARMIVGLGS